jgi:transcriptional regulator with XRE-family HTH domain
MISKEKVRTYREKLDYTQTDLAESANLSLRTIQRIESGHTIPKGHTLSALTEALGITKAELTSQNRLEVDKEDALKIKLINLSALAFIGIPFGNILLPYILWSRNRKSDLVDDTGRRIINYQIIWSVITSILMILSPFVQKAFSLPFPLLLYVLLICMSFNLIVIIKTAMSINKNNFNILNLSFRIL